MSRKIALALFAILAFSVITRAADDPFMGTWKSRPSQAQAGGGQRSQSIIRYHEAVPGGMKISQDRTGADGKVTHPIPWVGKFDGSEVPLPGNQLADMTRMTRPDKYHIELHSTKNGKPSTVVLWEVSQDGKTMTTKTTRLDVADPDKATTTLVFDKQ